MKNAISILRHELSDVLGGLKSVSSKLKNNKLQGVSSLIILTQDKLEMLLRGLEGIKNDIVGSYLLESCEIQREGENYKSWGTEIHGHLIYTPEGRVSVSINRKGTEKDSLFYTGKYESLGCGKLKHVITESNDLNRIGKTKDISYEIEKEILKMVVHATYGDIRLVWRRI